MTTSAILHALSRSDSTAVRLGMRLQRKVRSAALPVPMPIVRPVVRLFVIARAAWYWALRVLVCEPFFKAACRSYGRGVHTDVYLHWIQGHGDLIVGNDVLVDGKCSITFASRYTATPRLTIGDHTGIGHDCRFTVGKHIDIGRHCRIAAGVWMFDSSGHPAEPYSRLRGLAASTAEVRPIRIGDNVWVGGRAIVHPGVTIGPHSIVSAGAVVMNDVPAYTVVAGNPARKIRTLAPIEDQAPLSREGAQSDE
jgi:acetyltransferase-like isoleucine patch superfamily enzyme